MPISVPSFFGGGICMWFFAIRGLVAFWCSACLDFGRDCVVVDVV